MEPNTENPVSIDRSISGADVVIIAFNPLIETSYTSIDQTWYPKAISKKKHVIFVALDEENTFDRKVMKQRLVDLQAKERVLGTRSTPILH